MKLKKCVYCDEPIKKADSDWRVGYDGSPAHLECINEDYPSTLITFLPSGEKERVCFDSHFVFDEEDSQELPYPIKSQKWVSTDAWRGYTDWTFYDEVVAVGDGWVTGYPDEDTKRKLELGDIFEKLQAGDLIAPCPLFWVFGVTSNVFSTASTLLINKNDEDIFKTWIEEINGGLDEFKEKFR